MHTVKPTPAADRALRRIGRRNHSAYLRIKAAIDSLAVDPRPPGARPFPRLGVAMAGVALGLLLFLVV